MPHVLVKTTAVDEVSGVGAARKPLAFNTEIEVVGAESPLNTSEGFERSFTPREVETSAGTFGDVSRYIQTLAGVVSDNDQRNDFLVRGGNPSENGFVIDNIEIPSINQLALSDSTGGLVSMLDSSAVQKFDLHTDAYDSRFDQRLSSIVEISTRPAGDVERHAESEVGVAGAGGSETRPLGNGGSLFVSARASILQYFTDDIGMNGVPVYKNAFIRAENHIGARNTWWGLSLTGIDSIVMTPSDTDPAETNPFTISYSGWRNTTGLNWQHIFSGRSFGVASIAHAAQSQTVLEQAQLQGDVTIYDEHTVDNFTTFKYDWTFQPNKNVTLTAGTRDSVDQLNYSVQQPYGLQNPYSVNPAPVDATEMTRRFATVSTAGYVQGAFLLPHHAKLVVGERGEQWALGGHMGSTGKALVSMPVFGKLAHIAYSEYVQLPPTLYLLTFNNLKSLLPIHSRQWTGGVLLAENRRAEVALEVYQKNYTNYPVAQAYPQLSMANIADTFGQAFLMFPMISTGQGLARGAELTARTHAGTKVDLTATMAYARSWYSGADGVLRRGNYDVPLSSTLTMVWRMKHNLTLSSRYTFTSGKPYTPDNMTLSKKQDRDVYDLTRINGVRAPAYQRMDFRFEQAVKIGRGTFTWHAGLENAFNHKNFYEYLWMPYENAPSEQDQMPILPDAGFKYSF